MADQGLKLFGFEIKRATKSTTESDKVKLPSIVPPTDGEDGAGYVTASGSHFGQFVNLDGEDSKDNAELIRQYRGVSMHPEVDAAIEDIANEAISIDDHKQSVELVLDNVDTSDKIKSALTDEFDNILTMMNFAENGHDMFRRWYIDGRMYHHLVVNESSPKLGILDIRLIDSAKTRKVKQIEYTKDPKTGAKIVKNIEEYYVYQDKPGTSTQGIKLTKDSVSYVTSGLLDQERKKVVSYLHKALKPINQLRMMEDSLVIYRLARAPERRIFYIDVGNLPRGKAEEYMKNIMTKYRNKLVYDASTGQLKDDRKHMSMLEDFWLPRREGGRGTEFTTLPGGENLGQIDDIVYFQKRLYRSLNVPVARLEQETGFSIGRSTEVSREEVKFQKFIDKLRRRFSNIFLEILRKQLLLKGIITQEDWDEWKNDIIVSFVSDSHFSELKEAEILRERLQTLDMASQYVGEYLSKEWVMKNVLMMSEEDFKKIKKEMDAEIDSGDVQDPAEKDVPTEPKSQPVHVVDAPSKEEPKEPKKEHVDNKADNELTETLNKFLNKKLGN